MDTYCIGLLTAKNIEEWTLSLFLRLCRTMTEMRLQLRWQGLLAETRHLERVTIHLCRRASSPWELWIIRTRCALVPCSIVHCIGEAIRRWWSYLSFAPGRVTSLELVDRVRTQTFDLTSWAAIQPLPTLKDLIHLHLVGYLDILQVGQLKCAVFIEVWAHFGWSL